MSSELHQGACACEGRRARRWASRTDGLPASSIDGTVCCLTRGWGRGTLVCAHSVRAPLETINEF